MTLVTYRRALKRRMPSGRTERAGPLEALGRALPLWRDLPPLERAHRALGTAGGAAFFAMNGAGWRAPAGAVFGAWLGHRAARAFGSRARRSASDEARAALPLLLDRLVTCVLAGMSIERALRTVAPSTPGALGAAMADGLRAMDAGMTREKVYERIAVRAGSAEVRAALAALARGERYGSSVADTLVALAHDVRSRERARAEAEARTAPLKMLFPLVLCFLPAFVLLTIAPIALSALRTLAGS